MLSPEAKAELPLLPWPAMIGMRNRVVHGYYDVDMTVVWDTITKGMPPLITDLKRHISLPA